MEENFEKVKIEEKNRLIHITLNNPPENFLTHQLLDEFNQAIDWVAGQQDIMAVLVTAAGGNFSAGFNYAEQSRELVFSFLESYQNICANLLNLEFPSLAVIDGKVKNWACDLLFFFDFVLASNRTVFQYDHLATGVYPPFGSLLLPETMGYKKAFQMLLEGKEIDSARAEAIGLVSQTCPREELLTELKKQVGFISAQSMPVLAVLLRNLRRRRLELFQAHSEDVVSDYLNLLTDLEDYTEGIQAWVEKRPPVWKNR